MLGSFPIPLDFPEEDRNACNGLIGSKCPIQGGVPLRYGIGIFVNTPILGVTVDIQFRITDDNGEMVVCYEYSQTIVS